MWGKLIVLAILGVSPATAQDMQSMKLAGELGSVLGSEEACGLSYDRAAIERFVESRVRPNDMGFPGMLNTMTVGSRAQIRSMSEAEKAAHCAQIRRIARSFNFVR